MAGAVPGIAIKIGSGSAASTTPSPSIPLGLSTDAADNLYGVYVQAVKGVTRQQWVIFPPPLASLGVKNMSNPTPVMAYLNRTQTHEGNRAKWYHMRQWETSMPFSKHFASLINEGWSVSHPVVVKMDVEEYLKVWNDRETPHKYLRAVDKVLGGMGLSVK